MLDDYRTIYIVGDDQFPENVSDFIALDDIDGEYDVNYCTDREIDDLGEKIEESKAEELIINAKLVKSIDVDRFDCTTRTYAQTADELELAKSLPYQTYGLCGYDARILAERIMTNDYTESGQTSTPAPPSKDVIEESFDDELDEAEEDVEEEENETKPFVVPRNLTRDDDTDVMDADSFGDDGFEDGESPFAIKKRGFSNAQEQASQSQQKAPAKRNRDDRSESGSSRNDRSRQDDSNYDSRDDRNYDTRWEDRRDNRDYSKRDRANSRDYDRAEPKNMPVRSSDEFGDADLRTVARIEREKRRAEQLDRETQERLKESRNIETLERDAKLTKDPAEVITCTSGKGGVGKTTLCAELGTMLAMTTHEKSTYKVCIVDLNIDFGNVSGSLNLSTKKTCMTYWAADIHDRIASGYDPKKIRYSQAEIKTYLQQPPKDPKSNSDEPLEGLENLYVLCAPFHNEDSARITLEEIEIMLDNVIENGGFDYVIIDTGNNTRDTTLMAIKRAKYVFLIAVQDVNAATSNQQFHVLFDKIHASQDIDMNKFYVVINKALPEKEAGISVGDVETFMKKMNRNHPIDTVGVIKASNAVIRATNDGTPLVYTDDGHEFTKSIGKIASFLNGTKYELETPAKRQSFLARLFKRKDT